MPVPAPSESGRASPLPHSGRGGAGPHTDAAVARVVVAMVAEPTTRVPS